MKSLVGLSVVIGIALCTAHAPADPVVVTSFPGNGSLAWLAPSNAISSIEWCSSLSPTATWHRSWLPLFQCTSTGGTGHATVPMLYRVSSWTNGLLVPSPMGRTYTFAVSNALGQTWTETIHMAGMVSIVSATNNYFMVDVREHYTGDPPLGLPKDDLWVGRSTEKELYKFDGVGREYLVWQNAPAGTSWTNGTEVSTIMTNETVVVPAGNFTDCIKIEREETDPSAPYRLEEWVKPGLFMVKWIEYDTTAAPIFYTLTTWSME